MRYLTQEYSVGGPYHKEDSPIHDEVIEAEREVAWCIERTGRLDAFCDLTPFGGPGHEGIAGETDQTLPYHDWVAWKRRQPAKIVSKWQPAVDRSQEPDMRHKYPSRRPRGRKLRYADAEMLALHDEDVARARR